ncbi:SPY4 protein, partial [Dromaius novaehollandiae]|nr:protein sprouty homolog 4 [Dromaius novaehollandiae]NXG32219.1 SPY4 protein [Dromaius novaehollandiae]
MEPRIAHSITAVPSAVMVQPFPDSRIPYGRLQHPLTVLPIDQVKTTHAENDYADSPTASRPGPGSQPPARCQRDVTHPWISFSGRPSSISSGSSTSSEQRLLDHMAPAAVAEQSSPRAVRVQPKAVNGKPPDPKGAAAPEPDKHFLLCEACGKCKCKECVLPRPLPSCWVCKQECLCSAQTLVSYCTCMCLVRGVFYHCANEDDEGTCADQPCSCARAHRCARWSFMGALSLLLPCLLCYPPAAGCLELAQRCYDRVSRPGCRCSNTNSVVCKALPDGEASRPGKPF